MEGMRKGGAMMNDVNKSEEDECFASCVCVHEKREPLILYFSLLNEI